VTRRLKLGDPIPPAAKGSEPVEVGWHPVCGHVRQIAARGRLNAVEISPALVYGVLPKAEAVARLQDCATCQPPEQMTVLAALAARVAPEIAGGGLRR
jgi:hypothetical protein